ncbi:transposase [Sorangium sp. So ce887]|uniref:transposase n=1 Tax=Sorangium sp. So ce887 TaxID=3133324 RepID=UPI003F634185
MRTWLDTLPPDQKANIVLFAMDMHRTFLNAVRNYPQLEHAVVVHAPFHIKLRFMAANPVRTSTGTARLLALGMQAPLRAAA